jgi:chromosomal replication initiation ATPase DnaA
LKIINGAVIQNIFLKSEDEIEAINLYKKFMNEGSQKDEELFGFDNHDQILGNEEFVEKVFKRKLLKEADEAKEMNFNMQTVTLEDILVRVANEFAVDKDELCIRNTNNQLSRKICIYLARRFTNMSNDSIAGSFGIKRAAVSMIKQRLDEQICHDNYLRTLISGLMHLITGKDKEEGQAFTDL